MSKAKGNKVDVSEGRYTGVIKTVADVGTQVQQKFQAKNEDDTESVRQYVMEVELVESSKKDKIVSVTKRVRDSKSPKSFLYKLMKAVGLDVKRDDLDSLLGTGAEFVIEHTENGNAKITDVIPLKKGAKFAKGFMDTKSMYLDETYRSEDFEAMPKFIQELALKSDEFTEADAAAKSKRKGKK